MRGERLKMKNFKAAIFDMDGTLIDSLILWDILVDRFCQRYRNGDAVSITPEDVKKTRTLTLKGTMALLHNNYALADSVEELMAAANEIIYDFYSKEVKLKEGVIEFLDYCRGKGIKMCIASATDIELITVAVRHCGIYEYFCDIISCAETGVGKDKPDVFLRALGVLGTDIDETYVFEDSHVAIATADKAGFKTVGIYDKDNFGHEEIKRIAKYYIDDGETLKKLIK